MKLPLLAIILLCLWAAAVLASVMLGGMIHSLLIGALCVLIIWSLKNAEREH